MRQLSPLTHTANMGIYGNAMSPFHLPYRRQSQSRNPHLLHLINQTYHTGHAQGIEGFQSPLKIFHLICFKLEWQLASDTKHEHNRAASDICGAKVFLTGSYLPTFKLFDALLIRLWVSVFALYGHLFNISLETKFSKSRRGCLRYGPNPQREKGGS